MTVSEKLKTINKKIEQNKAQYDLDKQTPRISTLLSGIVGKDELSTGKDVLPEKGLLEKAATIKRFEYSPLGNELKKQTDIAKKQYQGQDKTFSFSKYNKNVNESLIKKEAVATTIPKKKYNKSNLIYNRLSFYSYNNDKRFDSLSFESKYSHLLDFYDGLKKMIKMKTRNLTKKKEKEKGYNTVSELYTV